MAFTAFLYALAYAAASRETPPFTAIFVRVTVGADTATLAVVGVAAGTVTVGVVAGLEDTCVTVRGWHADSINTPHTSNEVTNRFTNRVIDFHPFLTSANTTGVTEQINTKQHLQSGNNDYDDCDATDDVAERRNAGDHLHQPHDDCNNNYEYQQSD